MTQYMLSVHSVAGAPTPDEATMQLMFAQVGAFNEMLRESGAWVFAGGMQPAETAVVVTAVDGEVTVTAGPFAVTHQRLGGFWIVEAPDAEAASKLAAKASAACMGPVEVRPFQEV